MTKLLQITRNYINLAIYFDVGIAVADRIIEFGPTIRPICLPFQPIDDPDHFKDQFVNPAVDFTNKLRTHFSCESLFKTKL